MTADEIRARSLAFKRDEFHAADAEADAALETLADYHAQVTHWGEGDSRVMATLKARADTAEARRHTASLRLLAEFSETVQLARQREQHPRP